MIVARHAAQNMAMAITTTVVTLNGESEREKEKRQRRSRLANKSSAERAILVEELVIELVTEE